MRLSEVFYSIQGEGPLQGVPTVFLRLQGCNLYPGGCCKWCDTKYAQVGQGGLELSPVQVADHARTKWPRVDIPMCITGGEPLLQEGTEELIATLNKYNVFMQVFTNGTLPKPRWYSRVTGGWVVDCKCPSAGVNLPFDESWLEGRAVDTIKFTVADDNDLMFATKWIQKSATKNVSCMVSPVIPLASTDVYINPVDRQALIDGNAWAKRVCEFAIDKGIRFSLQWHKMLWGNKRRV